MECKRESGKARRHSSFKKITILLGVSLQREWGQEKVCFEEDCVVAERKGECVLCSEAHKRRGS